jgi:hypothetical protein
MPKKPQVVWESGSLEELQKALRNRVDEGRTPSLNAHRKQADNILQETFPAADVIVVQNRFAGFSVNTTLDILLVQVIPGPPWDNPISPHLVQFIPKKLLAALKDDPASYIVKVDHRQDDPSPLMNEWLAWLNCRPPGLRTDNLLTGVRGGAVHPKTKRLQSLIYNDGHAVLGSGETVSLEQAVLRSCRYGQPSVSSLELGIHRLFNRLNGRFYGQSRVPLDSSSSLRKGHALHRRLTTSLKVWQDSLHEPPHNQLTGGITTAQRRQHRREALGMLANQRETFIDPCDYLNNLLENPQECPRLLHGCSHGDLHGRNVLVSVVDDEVGSFVLFDYEEMRPDNLVGWDFVKLETELKVRVYPKIFSTNFSAFVTSVHKFEEQLAQLTDDFHSQGSVDRKLYQGISPKSCRLARLIMAIRTRAKQHLGVLRGRSQEWLEEYYFLLCCYGVYSAKFTGYGKNELLGAYISAGVAAQRTHEPWHARQMQKRTAELAANDELVRLATRGRPAPTTSEDAWRLLEQWCKEEPLARFSYRGLLDFVRVWSRKELTEQLKPYVNAAQWMLERLCDKYPHVAEFEEELTLVLRELHRDEEAESVLQRLQCRYTQLSEESLCRFGAHFKRQAQRAWRPEQIDMPPYVRHDFGVALEYYQRAFALRSDYYPGINVAVLKRLLGDLSGSEDALAKTIELIPADKHDPIWRAAIRGDADLLRGHHPVAEQHYYAASQHHDCTSHARRAMRQQIELLRRALDKPDQDFWNTQRLDALFEPKAEERLEENQASQPLPPPPENQDESGQFRA